MSVQYELNNKYRVLLTEVLPYEIPLVMDNTAFFHIVKDKDKTEVMKFFKEYVGLCTKDYSIPFSYSVRFRGGMKSRELSLMHPSLQLQWVEVYDIYSTYLLYLCSRSPYSLRHISGQASCLVDEKLMEKDDLFYYGINKIELLDACWGKQYQSYFRYQKYNVIFKFYEGVDFIRLEQKYSCMMQTDISKCFYHIYTHSIAWAVKGKDFAKEHIGSKYELFENKLDSIMQHCNYNETNGIIVGPEVSRIFAEIILQRVDLNLLESLKCNAGLRVGIDYEIRRYVDDYFIFTNNKEDAETILRALSNCLSVYKLDLNSKKTEITMRPFSNTLSDAKQELRGLVNELDDYISIAIGEKKAITLLSHNKLFKQIVGKFRNIVHHYHLSYSDLSSYMMTLLRKKAKKLSDMGGKVQNVEILLAVCDIAFYIYSLDMYATVSYKICDIVYLLNKCASKLVNPDLARLELVTSIDREIQRCLQLGQRQRKEDELNIEAINLLLTLDRVSIHPISKDKIAYLFGKTSSSVVEQADIQNMNYFQIGTFLYIVNNRTDMADWKKWLLDSLPDKFCEKNWKKKADLCCLFMDLMTCPYILKQEKIDIMVKAVGCNSSTAGSELKKIYSCSRFFFDWDRNRDFGLVLEKKRYHFAYG